MLHYYTNLEISKDEWLRKSRGNFEAKIVLSDDNISDLNWWIYNLNSSSKPIT